ncbi:uncharacterized protein LOC114954239 isoform X2 [Acropora millepora]|nr:uncharacterized protein LOC114954239 isoform X2 [Acropora millepora]
MSARNKKLEDENSRKSARIKELEEMIQKNKVVLETVAVAVQDMEKYPEQRKEESLQRIKSQLKRDKLDVDNTNECLVSSVDGPNTAKDKEPKNDLLGHDATVPQQDEVHLLQSFEEQLLLCQGIFDALIKLIGEVSPQPKDNDFVWMSNLFFFTKALKNQEKLFSSKIKSLKSLKDNSNKDQSGELEKLVKRYKTHQQKVDELETLLSSLLFQRQGTKNQRSKPCSSKHSSQSQGLGDFQNIARPSISKPLCAHHMSTMDTEKEPEEGQSVSSQIRCQSDTSAAKKPKKQNDETRRPASYSSPGSDWKDIPLTKNNTLSE